MNLNKLALNLPGFGNVNAPPDFKLANDPAKETLGYFIGQILEVMFFIGAFMMFTYMLWGAYQYMIAQGKKEDLAKARQRITWALLGFLFLVMAFFLYGYAKTIFPQVNTFTKVTELTKPCGPVDEKTCKRGQRCYLDNRNRPQCTWIIPTPTP